MPQRPLAHLMLPSPLGLLEYDVIEDAVFLGPNARGGLQARPTPFKGACMALTRAAEGFVARPLPGEAQPLINGEVLSEKVLEDGDRIGLGDQVALFRTRRGLVALPEEKLEKKPETKPEPKPRTRARPAPDERPARRGGVSPAGAVKTVIALAGAAVLLYATVRAVTHLKDIKSAEISQSDLPEMPRRTPGVASRAAKAFDELLAVERRDPTAYADLISRYGRFTIDFQGTPEEKMAHARMRELMTGWSERARAELDRTVERLVGAHQFARALKELREFERRFGATRAADGLPVLRADVRAKARAALDRLIAKVGPLITPQPRAAHQMLMGVSHEFPADMAAEVVVLIERAVARMTALGEGRRRKGQPEGASPLPALPGDDGGSDEGETGDANPGPGPRPGPQPGPAPEDADALARRTWKAAHTDLQQGRYAEALQAYTMLIQQHGNTALYRANKSKITAGRYSAKVGAQGPAGMLVVPAKEKAGRIEIEYPFDDPRELEDDWTEEQPFSSDMPTQLKLRGGHVLMEQATGLFHELVFLPDVTIEADVVVEMPHDFGLLVVQDSDDYRAILFNVANTKFTLKKGAAAYVNPGHLLWYIGQGVWSAADADAHGYIKIAERGRNKLEGGDRLKMEMTRRKGSAEASFQGKTDGVHLEGKVKGDDGSTMGPGRVGVFTNSGIIRVESIRISGKVDLSWFRKQLEFLVASDPGPDGE